MAAKLVSLKPWKDVVGNAKLADKGLQQALSNYKGLKPQDRPKRLAALTSIDRIVLDLGRLTEVTAIPAAKQYLKDIATALKSERLELQQADAEATIKVTIQNGTDDVILTIEDLNLGRDRIILDRKRVNKSQSVSVTLAADGSGKGQITWRTDKPNDVSDHREETVTGIKDGATVKVRL